MVVVERARVYFGHILWRVVVNSLESFVPRGWPKTRDHRSNELQMYMTNIFSSDVNLKILICVQFHPHTSQIVNLSDGNFSIFRHLPHLHRCKTSLSSSAKPLRALTQVRQECLDTASATAGTASSSLITRWRSLSPSPMSLCLLSCPKRVTGIPVHLATTSAI